MHDRSAYGLKYCATIGQLFLRGWRHGRGIFQKKHTPDGESSRQIRKHPKKDVNWNNNFSVGRRDSGWALRWLTVPYLATTPTPETHDAVEYWISAMNSILWLCCGYDDPSDTGKALRPCFCWCVWHWKINSRRPSSPDFALQPAVDHKSLHTRMAITAVQRCLFTRPFTASR